eukprot:scaffold1996_cov127-Cylindrotheca_fusiformis.AAC.10
MAKHNCRITLPYYPFIVPAKIRGCTIEFSRIPDGGIQCMRQHQQQQTKNFNTASQFREGLPDLAPFAW